MKDQEEDDSSPAKLIPVVDAVAGITAGCATTLIVHPLDLIKVRLQVSKQRSHIGSVLEVIRSLQESRRPFKEAYRGLIPNLVGNTMSWGAYFFWYEIFKNKLVRWRHFQSPDSDLGFVDYLSCAALSGSLTTLCTNPIWVIKTRMLSTNSDFQGAYTNMLDGIRKIGCEEGFRGFYRGIIPSLLGVSHGAVQLMLYEKMKQWYTDSMHQPNELSTMQYITCSGLSKIGASFALYPTQVLRSRLQQYNAARMYLSTTDVIIKTAREEGINGFYKGLLPNLFRVVPATCVTFVVYENTKKYINRSSINI
ncbi:mitochondrial carrier domain-containing protein [Lipomyces oligophaga]|uniref:mitochondrial carrier domain-containing protein n=1 Tax=Lipomyces oligophaga TaxID=45792 RepID=UPI0034CFCA81